MCEVVIAQTGNPRGDFKGNSRGFCCDNGTKASEHRKHGGKRLTTNQCEKRAGKRRSLGMEATQIVTSAFSCFDVVCEVIIAQTGNQHREIQREFKGNSRGIQ